MNNLCVLETNSVPDVFSQKISKGIFLYLFFINISNYNLSIRKADAKNIVVEEDAGHE